MIRRHVAGAVALGLAAVLAVAAEPPLDTTVAEGVRPPFDPGKVSFSVEAAGETSRYRELALFVMPSERLDIAVTGGAGEVRASWNAGQGRRSGGLRRWSWEAPEAPGMYPIELRTDRESMRLNVFVMVPLSQVRDGVLNGYRIGSYPSIPLKGLAIYRPPPGLVEVTEELRDTRVSPHFTLGQFLCKQEGGWPRYLVLRTRLVLKLEAMLELVNQAGVRCDTFHVMSGYRTPYYNHAIGNVRYSRHQWGGAADIFVDEDPRDGDMDDLNGDGRVDVRDARVLYELVDRLYGHSWYERYVGGLGLYRRTSAHGPFVHVDARGFRARWGD